MMNAGYSIRFGLFDWSPWPWGVDRAKRPAADTLAGYYKGLPDTLAGTKAAIPHMDLTHKQYAPTPKSIRWWLMTLLLLNLGIWQRVIKSSMALGFAGLQALYPAGAQRLTELQQRSRPPWKNIGHAPVDRESEERSRRAAERQRASIEGSAGKGLVGAAAAVDGGGGEGRSGRRKRDGGGGRSKEGVNGHLQPAPA